MNRTILFALLLSCGAAQAAEWVLIGKTSKNNQDVFVDVSSIMVKRGDVREAWVKYVYAPHSKKGPSNTALWLDYLLLHTQYDCSERTFRIDSGVDYYEDGTAEQLLSGAHPSWIPAAPDSAVSHEMKWVCVWTPK